MLNLHSEDIELNQPVLIAAFRGWNDAGESATFAASHLARVWSATPFGDIDPEEFYVFTESRPNTVILAPGQRATQQFVLHGAPGLAGSVLDGSVPLARVLVIPPIVASAPGSTGKNIPFGLRCLSSCCLVTPACTVQSKSSELTRRI